MRDLRKQTYQTETSITSPLTAFGELTTAENTAFIQATAVYDQIPQNLRSYTFLGGTTGTTSKLFFTSCGTTVNAYAAIQSFRSINYNAGQGGLARFTARFSGSVANHISGVGLVNLSDELSFGYNGTDFGIWHRRNGIAECRTITVTGASGGSTNLTLTLNSVAYTIPLTAGTTDHNAYEIATWLNANQSVWYADQIGNTVIIIAESDGSKGLTYSYSHATSTGTIVQNKAGASKDSDFYLQTDWNRNTMPDLDPEKGNVFQIQYQYLGFGNIFFYVESTQTGRFELVHVIEWANNNFITNLTQPSLRLGMYSASLGSTTDITTYAASLAGFVQGNVFNTRNPRAVKNTQTVSTTLTNVLSIRNRKTYNFIMNQVEIEPINLTISSESSKNVEIELRANPTFSGDTNYQNAGNQLVGDLDTTANTVSNGTLLASFTLSPNGNQQINLKTFQIRIPPTLVISVAARVTGGASSPVTATLTYYEDI